jgi:hypothetical protein
MMRKFIILVTVVLILSLLLPISMVNAASPQDGPPGLERAKEVKDRNAARLLEVSGVVAVGVGPDDAGRTAVVIFTDKPGVRGLPASLEGVPVVSRVSGQFFALPKGGGKPPKEPNSWEWWPRPVPIGVSTGHPDITAGTIGARLTDGVNVYALSNNHVYANVNKANYGDNVLQPGTYDGGTNPTDKIGTLSAFVPLDLSGGPNVVDAAIALSNTDLLRNSTPSNGYGTPRKNTVSVDEIYWMMKVKKYGRTTGLTNGQVVAIYVEGDINYGTEESPLLVYFTDMIGIYPGSFSAGGDSGSLIVTNIRGANDRRPVGLLFAGSQFYTLANPIDDVLAELSGQLGSVLEIDGE